MNEQNNRPSWQTPDYSYGAQPGPYTPPPAPAGPPRKRRRRLRTLGIILAGIVGLILVAGVIGSLGDPGQTAKLPVDVTTKAGKTPPLPPAASSSAPAKPAAKRWVPLTTVTGGTEKTSDTIRTTGGKIRVTWKFTGGAYAMGAIYLLDEGTDLQTDGGIPVATVDETSTADSIVLRKAAGEYFVQVAAANAKYRVTVEEER